MAAEKRVVLSEVSMSEKMWGAEPFWGLGYEWDPDWVLTDRQKELRATLIELCEKELRANAKRSDDELLYPRRNLELLGEHGFLWHLHGGRTHFWEGCSSLPPSHRPPLRVTWFSELRRGQAVVWPVRAPAHRGSARRSRALRHHPTPRVSPRAAGHR